MPQGIMVIGWDAKLGAVVLHKFPDWLPIPSNEVMAIYNAHTLGGRHPGRVLLTLPLLKVVSYYMGDKTNKCISLILDKSEKPNIFFDNIEETLMDFIHDSVDLKYVDILPKIYKKFEKLSEAQSAVNKIINLF